MGVFCFLPGLIYRHLLISTLIVFYLKTTGNTTQIRQLGRREDAMQDKAFQDFYPDEFSICYGCGRLNAHGLQIKSYWDGDESVCKFEPKPYHVAFPGIVYGGLIASLVDCHSTGTAAAAAYRAEGRKMGSRPSLQFVTGSLHVDFLSPTPIEGVLEVRSRIKEIKERKVVVTSELIAGGEVCARGEVVAVRMPENMKGK